MEAAVIQENILFIIADQLGKDKTQLKASDRFVDDLGIDSLDMIEMIMAAEDEFKITIKDEQAEEFITIEDAVKAVTGIING